jgi:alkylation response protein AidB-like acyl-CoA dehydrogenase
MANFLTDNADLRWYLERGIDWDPIVRLTERGFLDEDGPKSTREAVDLYKDIAEMFGKFVAEEVAPHAAEIDAEGVRLENGEAVLPARMNRIFEQLKALDLHWLCVPRELGGMNCPLLLYFINSEVMSRADVSVMAHHGFHGGMAMAMLIFSIREGSTEFEGHRIVKTRFAAEIEEIGSGRAWGCMDITEPDAGSDMAALRTVGEQDEHGNWFVTGQKIFITSGHGKYHFVIARTEKPSSGSDDPFAGLGGLSFFLVPTYTEDASGKRTRHVSLDRVEEKLGHHGSCTAALTFERAPAQLIGKRGEGFKHMLTLMNNARLGVGFECIGTCEAALRLARAYAAERPSMGKTIDRHEMIADYLDEMQAYTEGLRAIAMTAAVHEEVAQKSQLVLEHYTSGGAELPIPRLEIERTMRRSKAAARRLTPLLKYLAAEKAVWAARMCVQIHGGNGYMREYGAERLLRDAMVMPIYEGTSQIQALMAMKDTLGNVMKAPQQFVKKLAQARWRSLSARDVLERRVAKLQVLSLDAQQYLMRRTAADKLKGVQDRPISQWPKAFLENWDPKRDFAYAMLHAEHLCELLAHEAICEILLDQAKAHPERTDVLRRFLVRAEPRVRHLHDLILTTGQDLLDRLAQGASAEASVADVAE